MLSTILNKILLGISLAAPLGPVNIEIIKRGLAYGFWPAFSVRLGGAITNSAYLLIAYFSIGQLLLNSIVLMVIVSVAGCIVLVTMGIITIIKVIFKNELIINKINNLKFKNSTHNGILTGMLLSCISPIGITFWLTTFAASIRADGTAKFCIKNLFINFFIIIGVLIWGLIISSLLHFGKKLINTKILKIIFGLSGILLICFGIKYIQNILFLKIK
jgi:L-lysine exporter family protein LysE/ArgO